MLSAYQPRRRVRDMLAQPGSASIAAVKSVWPKVISLEQLVFTGGLGQCVREAVCEVQAALVAADRAGICPTGDAGLITGHGLDVQFGGLDEFVEAAAGDRVPAGIDDDRGLQPVSSEDPPDLRFCRTLLPAPSRGR